MTELNDHVEGEMMNYEKTMLEKIRHEKSEKRKQGIIRIYKDWEKDLSRFNGVDENTRTHMARFCTMRTLEVMSETLVGVINDSKDSTKIMLDVKEIKSMVLECGGVLEDISFE